MAQLEHAVHLTSDAEARGSSINISNATIIDKAIPESVPLVIYVVRPRNVFNRRLLGRLPFPGLVRGHSGSVGIIACIFFMYLPLYFVQYVCFFSLFSWQGLRIRYFLTGFVSGTF